MAATLNSLDILGKLPAGRIADSARSAEFAGTGFPLQFARMIRVLDDGRVFQSLDPCGLPGSALDDTAHASMTEWA